MADGSKFVSITNRNNGYTGYVIPDRGIRRSFTPGETKKVELDELVQLSYMDGGDYLLKNYFIIRDKDALSFLNIIVEPEYFYTEEEIKKILSSEGTMDQLEDTLNFAPDGVIELLKQIAVETELFDTKKRALITKMTGFNIDNAINVNRVMNAETQSEEEETKTSEKVRKATPVAVEASAPTRKAAAIKVTPIQQ